MAAMNFSSFASEITAQVSQISPSSILGTLWAYYLEYLWFYEPDSLVARIAYSFRIMAILISLPIVILALLDISSYGIARTLGVIEDVKASTSDKPTRHAVSSSDTPVIRITGSLTPSSTDSLLSDSDFESMTNHSLHNRMRSPLSDSVEMSASESSSQDSQPSVYYAGEDTSLKLAGVGLFSPAASQPPSPTISRRHLPQEEQLRHRIQQANGTIEE